MGRKEVEKLRDKVVEGGPEVLVALDAEENGVLEDEVGETRRLFLLSERDTEVLNALAACEVMTTDQIRRRFHGGRRWYVYKELGRLVKIGLLETVYVWSGDMRTKCYLLSAGAYEELGLEGEARHARRLRLMSHAELMRKLAVAELYVQLHGHGWVFVGGRDAKRRYGLNRASLLDAVLRDEYGERHAVYLLGWGEVNPEAEEQVLAEIARHVSTGLRSAVLLAVPEGLRADLPPGVKHLMVLRYPEGVDRLRLRASLGRIVERELGLHERRPSGVPFALYETELDGERYVVAELVTNDLAVREGLSVWLRTRGKERLVLAVADPRDCRCGEPGVRCVHADGGVV